MYGAAVPFDTVLKGNQATPAEARPFVRTVAKYFRDSKERSKVDEGIVRRGGSMAAPFVLVGVGERNPVD